MHIDITVDMRLDCVPILKLRKSQTRTLMYNIDWAIFGTLQAEPYKRKGEVKICYWIYYVFHRIDTIQMHLWSSGKILPCHGREPGSIPGRCIIFCLFSSHFFRLWNGLFVFPSVWWFNLFNQWLIGVLELNPTYPSCRRSYQSITFPVSTVHF